MDLPVCTPILQTHHILYLIYAYIQCWPWNFHMSTLPPSCNCHVILPHTSHHFSLSVHLYYSVHISLLNRCVCQFVHYFYTSPWRQWLPCPHLAVNSSCESALHCSPKQQTLTSRWQHCHRWVHCLPQKYRLNGSWLEWYRCTYMHM